MGSLNKMASDTRIEVILRLNWGNEGEDVVGS